MKYQAVIFDLDGTLLDTLDDLTDSMNQILCRYGRKERTREEAAAFLGNGSAVYLKLAAGEPLEDFETCLKEYKAYYKEHMEIKTKPFDGILELLWDLRRAGVKTAVVSNKFDGAVKGLCKKYFGHAIDLAVGEGNGLCPKPAGDMVEAAAKKLGVSLENCLYVGDTEVDLATARAVDMDCVSVTWGFRTEEQLKEEGAVCLFGSVEALRRYLLAENAAEQLEVLPYKFSVCQISETEQIDWAQPFCFTGKTDREFSLVCLTEHVPEGALAREDGWRAFRIEGTLDFSLIGILSRISGILAQAKVGIFAVSTYQTDYILVRETQLEKAVEALRTAGYAFVNSSRNIA